MKDNFTTCLEETLKWEGGYSNHPLDPGGPTNLGIIQTEYDKYNINLGRPQVSVKAITKAEAIDIYKKNYWDACACDSLDSGLDLAVFDFAVNSGPSRSLKTLAMATDINKFMNERERFLRSLKTFPTFGKGWMNRTKGIRAKALSMSTNTITTKDVVASSTKLTTLAGVRKGLTGITVVGGGLMSLDTVTNASLITNYLKTFLSDHWIPIALLGVGSIWLFLKWLEWMHIVDFKENRYLPSGMVQGSTEEKTDA